MNRKSIAALAVAAVMTLGVGASSYAWFTSQATSVENTFTAGRLTVDFNAATSNTTKEAGFAVANLQPGEEQAEVAANIKTVSIKNAGTLPLNYYVTATMEDKGSGKWVDDKWKALKDVLCVKVLDGGKVVYNGLISTLVNVNGTGLSVDATKDFTFKFYLPGETTNVYQGLSSYVKLGIHASQTNVNSMVSQPLLTKIVSADGVRLELDFKLDKGIDLGLPSGDIQIAYGTVDTNNNFIAALRTNGTPIIKSKLWDGYLNSGAIKYSQGYYGTPTYVNEIPMGTELSTVVDGKYATMKYADDLQFINTVKDGTAAVKITVIDNLGNMQTMIVKQR